MANMQAAASISVHPPTQNLVLQTSFGMTTIKVGTPEYTETVDMIRRLNAMTKS